MRVKYRTQFTDKAKAILFASFLISFFVGASSGAVFGLLGATVLTGSVSDLVSNVHKQKQLERQIALQQPPHEGIAGRSGDTVVAAVAKIEPAVVSIVVTKEVPRISRRSPLGGFFNDDFFSDFFGGHVPLSKDVETEKRRVGGGTGFFVSSDGLLITNKHVVNDENAEYSVLLNDGRQLEAEVLARDPSNDLAVLEVMSEEVFPTVQLGRAGDIALGQTVVAIGNALGEFRNTVSVGVVSGLSRSITASGANFGSEQLSGVIQTDAAINSGNSGGPLANLRGEVIGINTAVATRGENIGFAIPVDEVRFVINSIKEHGRVVRPFLGVRYVAVTSSLARANNLSVDYGALIVGGSTDAIVPGSPADKAGLKPNDIILAVADKQVTETQTLVKLLSRHRVGSEVTLTVLRDGKNFETTVVLVERE